MIQVVMKRVRSSRSTTQLDRGLREGYALAAHISGTWLSYILEATASSSGLITTRPLMALIVSFKLLDMTDSRALYLRGGRAGGERAPGSVSGRRVA